MKKLKEISIDCDANPFLPNGWKVEEHQKGGQWKFDPKGVEFFLSNSQKGGKVIEGNKLRKELAKKPVFNANVLDYLLEHPHLIPEEWKGKYVFFWGTVYRHSSGYLFVRCLDWRGDGWDWDYRWLDYGWGDVSPAAVPASSIQNSDAKNLPSETLELRVGELEAWRERMAKWFNKVDDIQS